MKQKRRTVRACAIGAGTGAAFWLIGQFMLGAYGSALRAYGELLVFCLGMLVGWFAWKRH